MNPDLERLHSYPFEKLASLMQGARPPQGMEQIALSIGEPRHAPPAVATRVLTHNLEKLASYPSTRGLPALRQAIAHWLERRFQLPAASIDPEHQVLPVNGTREALFAFAQAVIDRSQQPLVVMPNPFYQIYEGAAFLAGAEPWYLNCTAATGFQPDFDSVPAEVWQRCQLLYICSPGNPTGAVMDMAALQQVIALARQHDFVIASDECYSEIYRDEEQPPPGLLQAAAAMGLTDYTNCVVFHSLSKRSNLPGLRSGFVAGDRRVIEAFFRYRTYHGCAMAVPTQMASIAAWEDEDHVRANRHAYNEKFDSVSAILGESLPCTVPAAGFYLWPRTPIADTHFSRELFEHSGLTVLPGSFLGRRHQGCNPGSDHVRIALVPSLENCSDAAHRIVRFLETL